MVYERCLFLALNQRESEPVKVHIAEFRPLAPTRNFDSGTADQLVRENTICELQNESLHQHLPQIDRLTLQKCTDICLAAEDSKPQESRIQVLRGTGESQLNLDKEINCPKIDTGGELSVIRSTAVFCTECWKDTCTYVVQ